MALAERARLSREIHDTLLQSLVGVALQFDGIANALGPSSVSAREQLTRIRRQVEAYIREARQSILEPQVPHPRDPRPGRGTARFRQAAHRRQSRCDSRRSSRATTVRGRQRSIIRCCASGRRRSPNAVRHARARRIHLEMRREKSVTLRVEDDGCGFEGDLVAADSHDGVTTMRERAEELGGTLTVTSAAGRVILIEAVIPPAGHVRNNLPAAI